MRKNYGDQYGYLDRIRRLYGADECRAALHKLCKNSRRKAIATLNDSRMTFPCLFILLPQIKALGLMPHLQHRYAAAAVIIDQIANPERSPEERSNVRADDLLAGKVRAHSALKWMLETGSAEDDLSDDYRRIMDVAASVLLNTCQDKACLPIVCDLLFSRSQRGYSFHDLFWAFFRTRDPDALRLVAQRLNSPDWAERALARKLLHMDETPDVAVSAGNQKPYEDYLRWLDENDPFLYFTEESLQFSGKPTVCQVDLERKYMQQGIPAHTKRPIASADSAETQRLAAFTPLPDAEKAMLSDYSHRIHNADASQWKRWIAFPVEDQIRMAKASREGMI